jgi:hypothetical protein
MEQRSKPDAFAEALRVAQELHPTLRTCQILVNSLGTDPFYLEDDEAISRIYAYVNGVGTWGAPDV